MVSAWGRLQNASVTHTWMGKVHTDAAGSPSFPNHPHVLPRSKPAESLRGTSPSLGQPHPAPVPPPPECRHGDPPCSPALQSDLSRAGSAAGQPQREKTAIASRLSALGAGGETPVGWEQGKGRGDGPRVTPGLPPDSSDGATRAPGRIIPFGVQLPHPYSSAIKPIYTAPPKKWCFSSQNYVNFHA